MLAAWWGKMGLQVSTTLTSGGLFNSTSRRSGDMEHRIVKLHMTTYLS